MVTAVVGQPEVLPRKGFVRSEWLFLAWIAFAYVNVVLMYTVTALGAVAFHLVWISMAIVYGVQGWSARRTAVMLAVVVLATGLSMSAVIRAEAFEWTELTEVPLMAAVFVTMVWHVRRRAAALAESEAAAERERRANELKEVFVRQVSHQMRTPITVARGYAELVRAQVEADGTKEDVDVVLDELDRLAGFASRLLVLADVYEAGDFEIAPVDLQALVTRAGQRWRPTADRQWRVEASPVTVEGDESRLESAFDTLVENAVKFTADGDPVTLRCAVVGREAVLEVCDGGVGFAAARSGRPTKASGGQGTGLGLAIVRAVAQAHHGRLVVQDAPSAEGASVSVVLPLPRR